MAGLFTALIAPHYVDWSVYKQDFEREASRIIGQTVTVGGEPEVQLLPMPGVTFKQLTVGDGRNGSPIATVDEFSVRAELMPILQGQIRIRDMRLVRPIVQVNVTENGQITWTNRNVPLVDPDKINLENLSVEDGTIEISGLAGGRTFTATNLNGGLSAKTLLGPWRIDASGKVAGIQSRWSIATGTLQPSGEIRVKLSSEQLNLPYKLSIDGPVRLRDGVLVWGGEFRVDPLRGDALTRARDAGKPLDAVGEGVFLATPQVIEVPDYRLEIGSRDDPYTVTGSGGINIGEDVFFKLLADGRQIDLNRVDLKSSEDNASGEKMPVSLETRFVQLRSILERIPVPGIDGLVSVELPAIVAGDTLIRKVSIRSRPVDGGWNIQKFNAILPGNTVLDAAGRLDLFEDFGFNGKLLLASRQPSGFASWIAGEVAPSIRRLKSAGFEADATLSPHQISLENLELVLDDALLKGSVKRLTNAAGRPGMIAKLSGDQINIEDLRAIYALTQGEQEAGFSNHDVDFTLITRKIDGKIFGEKLEADNVDMHLRLQDGGLSIEQLNAGQFLGAQIESSGRVDNLLSKPHGNFRLGLRAEDATQLAALAQRMGAKADILDAYRLDKALSDKIRMSFELDATATPTGSSGVLLVDGEVGGTTVKSNIGFDGSGSAIGQAMLKVSTRFENSTPYLLLSQLGVDVLPVPIEGPLHLTSDFSGQIDDEIKFSLNANAPDGDASLQGAARNYFERERSVNFDLKVGSTNIQPYLTVAGFVVPGVQLFDELPLSASLSAKLDDGDWKFDGIDAKMANNTLAGNLSLIAVPSARSKLFGNLRVEHASLPVIADMVFGELAPGLGQPSPDEGESSFSKSVLEGIDGELKLEARNVDLGLGESAKFFKSKIVLLDGSININDGLMDWMGGELSGNLSFQNADGTGVVSSQFQLTDAELEKVQSSAGLPLVVSGSFNAGGTFDSTGRSMKGLISGLGGSGIIAIDDGVINGINAQALPQVLLASDAESFEISTDQVDGFVDEIILDRKLAIGKYSEAFSLVNGRLQLRNMNLQRDGVGLAGQGEVDLASGEADTTLRLTLDAGKDAVTGASAEVSLNWQGPLANLKRTVNSQGLQGFLSIRAYEREQRRVELLQASILEKQRLRREVIRTNARTKFRAHQAELERLAEEARAAGEAESKKQEKEDLKPKQKETKKQKAAKEAENRTNAGTRRAAKAKAAAQARRKAKADQASRAKADVKDKRKARKVRLAKSNAEQSKRQLAEQDTSANNEAERPISIIGGAVERRDLPASSASNDLASQSTVLDRKRMLKELDRLLFSD